MKLIVTGMVLLLSLTSYTTEANWLTDMEQAKQQAKAEGKVILMNFSGSDWCANCMRLEKDLFQQEAFQTFAKENLVLLNLDFPARKQNRLSPEQTAHNEALAERYNQSGSFPLVLLLDVEGKVLGKMKHPAMTVEAYIANIKSLME